MTLKRFRRIPGGCYPDNDVLPPAPLPVIHTVRMALEVHWATRIQCTIKEQNVQCSLYVRNINRIEGLADETLVYMY